MSDFRRYLELKNKKTINDEPVISVSSEEDTITIVIKDYESFTGKALPDKVSTVSLDQLANEELAISVECDRLTEKYKNNLKTVEIKQKNIDVLKKDARVK